MKASFKFILAALAATAALAACTKNEPVVGTADGNGQMNLSVTGVLGEYKAAEGTKASLVNTPRVGWNGDETVHVFQQSDGKYLGSLTSSVKTTGASVATLGGTISSGTGKLVFVYTNTDELSPEKDTKYTSLEISLASQGTDIPFVVYGTAESPGTTSVSGLVVNFSFATSVVSTYAAGLPANTAVTQATLDNINTMCVLTIPESGDITVSGNTPGTITKTDGIGSTNAEGQVLFEIAVPVSGTASSGRSVEFTTGTGTCTTAFSGEAIAAGNAYSAMSENHSVEAVVLGKASTTIFPTATETLTATVYPSNSTNKAVTWTSSNDAVATVDQTGKVTGQDLGTATITATSQDDPTIKATCTVTVKGEYVEIGGLKWATCNIGATKPTDYGWYFSWGNTEGYVHDGTKWVKASDSSTPLGTDGEFSETNYASPGKDLTTDISPASVNDAARINWGGDWRMPTKVDFNNLYEACGGTDTRVSPTELSSDTPSQGIYWLTKEQTYIPDYTDVAGLLFVDENQNKLFFPAAGYGNGTSLSIAGSDGFYWSSSLNTDYPSNAYGLLFDSGDVSPRSSSNRYRGFSVRPVSDK